MSANRSLPATRQAGLGDAEALPERGLQGATVGDVVVEVDQGLLSPALGQQHAGQPGTLVRRPEVRRAGRELVGSGQVVRHAVPAYLPDDLPGRGAQRQVDVAEGDVVGEPLEEPGGDVAPGGVGGDVDRLVAEDHLLTGGLEPVEHLGVDEHVHGRVGVGRAVGRSGDGRDAGRVAGFGVQGPVERRARGRHLDHQAAAPVRKHATDDSHRGRGQPLVTLGLAAPEAALTRDHDQHARRPSDHHRTREPAGHPAGARLAEPGDRHPVGAGRHELDVQLRAGRVARRRRRGSATWRPRHPPTVRRRRRCPPRPRSGGPARDRATGRWPRRRAAVPRPRGRPRAPGPRRRPRHRRRARSPGPAGPHSPRRAVGAARTARVRGRRTARRPAQPT